jgi:hypothetical protein
MEDALKRLDKLTNDEARMANAQIMRTTHNVDERVRGVADQVANVDHIIQGVEVRMADVDERVKVVDDKVAEVIDGAQTISCHKTTLNPVVPRRKGGKGGHSTDS